MLIMGAVDPGVGAVVKNIAHSIIIPKPVRNWGQLRISMMVCVVDRKLGLYRRIIVLVGTVRIVQSDFEQSDFNP
jgi:hypothetical protein